MRNRPLQPPRSNTPTLVGNSDAARTAQALSLMDVQYLASPEDMYREHVARIARLQHSQVPRSKWGFLKNCDGGPCPASTCSAACVFGERHSVNKLVLEATNLVQASDMPMHFVHLVNPRYFQQPHRLADMSIDGLFQSLRRRMRQGGPAWRNALAVGGVHVSYDRYDDADLWTPHIHLVIAVDAPRSEVKEVMRPKCRAVPLGPNGRRIRTIVTDEVTNLANAISYSTKVIVDTREVTQDVRGNQDRQHFAMPESARLEHDRWLLRQHPLDRIFLAGMMQTRGGLRTRARSS